VIGYPEEMCKQEENQVEEEEEEEEEEEDQRINCNEIQLDQSGLGGGEGTVLSTHHLVYGEDRQVNDA